MSKKVILALIVPLVVAVVFLLIGVEFAARARLTLVKIRLEVYCLETYSAADLDGADVCPGWAASTMATSADKAVSCHDVAGSDNGPFNECLRAEGIQIELPR